MTSKTCILLAVCALWSQTTPAAPPPGLAARLEAHIESFAGAGQFTGSVLIASGGRVLLSRGYGMANREWSIPNTPRTKFRLGSVTKQFTATAIMQLETKGALSVQEPISKYVPDSPPAWKDITIQNLLTHTSGIHDYTAPPHPLKMRDPLAPAELLARLASPPLDFPPGTKFNYSNSGYAVLGYIIEKISGQTYESYIQQHIFEPAGMDSSGYDHPGTILEYRASGYANRNGILMNAPYIEMSVPYAAGGLFSTTEDMYRWDRALYTDKLLPQSALTQMFTPFKNNYGYGWFIRELAGHQVIAHGGNIPGFAAQISRFRAEGSCIIILSNLETAPAGRMAQELAAILFGQS